MIDIILNCFRFRGSISYMGQSWSFSQICTLIYVREMNKGGNFVSRREISAFLNIQLTSLNNTGDILSSLLLCGLIFENRGKLGESGFVVSSLGDELISLYLSLFDSSDNFAQIGENQPFNGGFDYLNSIKKKSSQKVTNSFKYLMGRRGLFTLINLKPLYELGITNNIITMRSFKVFYYKISSHTNIYKGRTQKYSLNPSELAQIIKTLELIAKKILVFTTSLKKGL